MVTSLLFVTSCESRKIPCIIAAANLFRFLWVYDDVDQEVPDLIGPFCWYLFDLSEDVISQLLVFLESILQLSPFTIHGKIAIQYASCGNGG